MSSKFYKSEKSEVSQLSIKDFIKLFPNDNTTKNNSLLNNPSRNQLELITAKVFLKRKIPTILDLRKSISKIL